MKNLFSIFPLLLLTLIISAQNSDSGKVIVKTPVAEYFTEREFFLNNSSFKSIDSSLDGIQRYFPNNFPYSLSLSNRRSFLKSSSEIGFRSGLESLDLFGYNRDAIKYYRARTPYTEIFALFGQKKEQFARLLHTQNITKQWNIALNMLRLRSEGFYNRQTCTDNNISLSSNYTSKSNRYSFLANGFISSIKTDENGGVSDDTVFESNLLTNKKLIAVNLSEARTRRGSREFTVIQFLNFGKRDTSAKTDSVSKKIIPRSSFSYSFHANENWFVYEDKDPSSGFYSTIFNDSTRTLDSTYTFLFQNKISWAYLFSQKKKIISEISFCQKIFQIKQNLFDSTIINNCIVFNFKKDSSLYQYGNVRGRDRQSKVGSFYWNIGGEYIPKEKNKNEYRFYINYFLSTVSLRNEKYVNYLSLKFQMSSQSVPLVYSFYSSNNFLWKNSFENMKQIYMHASYCFSRFDLEFGMKTIQFDKGFVYFNDTSSPVQTNDTISVGTFFLRKNFHSKHFQFNNNITYQVEHDSILHLPSFVSNHSLYYTGQWFKKAVDVQIGFDVTYFTSYYADAYMPALGQYYLQNEKKIGNYPFIDFFFNLKIKHARIFLKTEHLNSGLMGGYYLVPHNPAPDRSLKVGINWVFYD